MADIPVYVVAGFLDAGKTTFLNGLLKDGFSRETQTLLICCEEGEASYDPGLLNNVQVVTAEAEEALTCSQCKAWEAAFHPGQVLLEFNGMWSLERLYRDVLPGNWPLYQIMCIVDAATFEPYAKNFGQIMMEKIANADLLVFNRCTTEAKAALRRRNLRLVNRRADMFLEGPDGESEDYNNGEVCPFDLTEKVIGIPDRDYGVWYVDVMDYPERWAGKTVHLKLMMCHSKKYPGTHCPGRLAMVCCENDVAFMGLVAKGLGLEKYPDRTWVEAEGRLALEHHPAYVGKGPVLHIISIRPCQPPANPMVTF